MTRRREPVVRGPELRTAMNLVAESYFRFLSAGPEPATDDDTKAFAAHHAAARSALAHLEQLLKVARQIGADAPAIEEATTMIIEARAALALYEEDHDAGDDPA